MAETNRPTIGSRVRAGTVAVLCLGAAFFLFFPRVRGVYDESVRNNRCCGNLVAISLAMQQYHDAWDAYPPPFIADEAGTPIHSWRVLILPFLGHADLYNRYSFEEPWDGPRNRTLHDETADAFDCPENDGMWSSRSTSYLAITGPGTFWARSPIETPANVADEDASSAIVAEVANSGVHWMEPRDIDASSVKKSGWPGIGGRATHREKQFFFFLSSPYEYVGMLDGRCGRIERDVSDTEILRRFRFDKRSE